MRGWEVWGSVAPEAHVEVDFGAWDCRFLRAETQAAGSKAPPSERLLGWGSRVAREGTQGGVVPGGGSEATCLSPEGSGAATRLQCARPGEGPARGAALHSGHTQYPDPGFPAPNLQPTCWAVLGADRGRPRARTGRSSFPAGTGQPPAGQTALCGALRKLDLHFSNVWPNGVRASIYAQPGPRTSGPAGVDVVGPPGWLNHGETARASRPAPL